MSPPVVQPKFLRDSLQVSDILGASPFSMREKMERFEARNNIYTTKDIPGAVPKTHVRNRNLGPYDMQEHNNNKVKIGPKAHGIGYSNMDYPDLHGRNFVSRRVVNPLNPNYQVVDL